MPIYEYRCERCEQLSEFFLRVSDPHPESCPRCGEAGVLRKQISQTSFALKGEGWYVTDYKKGSPAKEEAKPAAEAASASAGEGKTGGDGAAGASTPAAAAAPAPSTSAAGGAGTASAGKDSTPASRGSDRSSGD